MLNSQSRFPGPLTRHIRRCIQCLFALLMLGHLEIVHADDRQEVRIGVRAHRGAEEAMKTWQATADHLTANIPGYKFIIVPNETIGSQNEAVSRGEFDFILSSPSSYVEYELRYGARHLTTLAKGNQRKGYTQFSSVIFTRADRNDIQGLSDLKGKSIMAVSELAFGGWRVAWHELRTLGIDPYRDMSMVKYAGGIQPDVVRAVLRGDADSGTVRTGMLESMAMTGEITLNHVKILNAKYSPNFPFTHSARLYPEWPFARLAHTDDALVQKVTRVLLNITPEMPAAQAGGYIGWHPPRDYEPVRQLLQDLGVGPYIGYGKVTPGQLLRAYGQWIALALLTLALLIGMMVRMKLLNSQLRATEVKLQNMAMHDGLTGLSNRYRLDSFLDKEWRQAARKQRALSAMLLDIDHFKQYNDHYGHLAGDDCLRTVAKALQSLFRRANDLVVRYGGEEFLVIMLDTDQEEAEQRGKALLAAINALAIPHLHSPVRNNITISIGISTCIPMAKTQPDRLIASADKALYQAKDNGRNQLICNRCGPSQITDPMATLALKVTGT